MAFDKVKTLRAAEKFLELGKIPAAIKEYCKIVESEPEDFTTLNMLGDLYARVGDQAAAVACFRPIAEHYRAQDLLYYRIRTKQSDSDHGLGVNQEAATCVTEAGQYVSASGACDEALGVFEKALRINPDAHGTLKGLLAAHSARGDADDAAELI